MMRTTTFALVLVILAGSHVLAVDDHEQEHIRSLKQTLKSNGIPGLLNLAKDNAWRAPAIPSRWHIEHVAQSNDVPVREAARRLGDAVASEIGTVEHSVLTGRADDTLHTQVAILLDFGDWCASSDGYGNLLLAQRCLDLAALGVTRLAVNVDFPFQKTETLSRRLDVPWISASARMRALNADAGAELFTGTQDDDLRLVWASGGVILREERSPRQKDEPDWRGGRKLIDTPLLRKNKAFFQDEDADLTETTLAGLWERKAHERLVTGLRLQSVAEAKALTSFRKRIGHFPEEDNPVSPYRGAKGAFDEAWRATVVKTSEMSQSEWNRQLGVGIIAWRAYDKVKRGTLLPAL
jgi:hypothetical protein